MPLDEEDAAGWLENWVEENLLTPGYHEHPSDMAHEAKSCREDAQAASLSEAALIEAAGGNLEAYLLREQNAMTDAEVRRQADKAG